MGDDLDGTDVSRAHCMFLDPRVQGLHEGAPKTVPAVLFEDGETTKLVVGCAEGFICADGTDRCERWGKAEEEVGGGFVYANGTDMRGSLGVLKGGKDGLIDLDFEGKLLFYVEDFDSLEV